MDKIVICPWCGSEMEVHYDSYTGRWRAMCWCHKCGAEGPAVIHRKEETKEELADRCTAAALKRYTPCGSDTDEDMRKRALDLLNRQIKKKRDAQAAAEERHKTQAQYGHCLECELREIRADIEAFEWLSAKALEG